MPNNATPIFDPSVYTVYSWHLFQKLVRVPEFSSEFRVPSSSWKKSSPNFDFEVGSGSRLGSAASTFFAFSED